MVSQGISKGKVPEYMANSNIGRGLHSTTITLRQSGLLPAENYGQGVDPEETRDFVLI